MEGYLLEYLIWFFTTPKVALSVNVTHKCHLVFFYYLMSFDVI